MDPLDYLSVRFHFRGEFENNGKEWIYVGGRHGMSTIEFPKLSLPELKRHLADHVACSDDQLRRTSLAWKIPAGEYTGALILIEDQRDVEAMLEHVIGVMDMYASIPPEDGENEQ